MTAHSAFGSLFSEIQSIKVDHGLYLTHIVPDYCVWVRDTVIKHLFAIAKCVYGSVFLIGCDGAERGGKRRIYALSIEQDSTNNFFNIFYFFFC